MSALLILVTTISYYATEDVLAASAPRVSSSSYIVMSGSTSERVAVYHADRKMQPGAITMLMTAMVVIDNMYDDRELDNTVVIDDKLAKYGDTFKKGETISVGDLLVSMLAGGDVQSAEALASYSASSREIFINEMNSKAMELGIMDTEFSNPGGEYSTDQYSTAADLAVITQAAFRYPEIRDVLKLTGASVNAVVKDEKRTVEIKPSNPLLSGDSGESYKYVIGGISGSLGNPVNASQFAAVSVKDDMQIIVILMDSDKDKMASEAKALLEYGDGRVTKNTIVKKDKRSGYAKVKGGAKTRVPAYTAGKGFAYVPPEGSDKLVQTRVVMSDDLEAPLKKGDKVGEFRIYVADELKGTVDLVIKEDVPPGWPPSRIYISNRAVVILCVLALLVLLFIIRVIYVKRRRVKRKAAMRRQKIRELARMQMEMDEDRRRRDWPGGGYGPAGPGAADYRGKAAGSDMKKGNSGKTGKGGNSGKNSKKIKSTTKKGNGNSENSGKTKKSENSGKNVKSRNAGNAGKSAKSSGGGKQESSAKNR